MEADESGHWRESEARNDKRSLLTCCQILQVLMSYQLGAVTPRYEDTQCSRENAQTFLPFAIPPQAPVLSHNPAPKFSTLACLRSGANALNAILAPKELGRTHVIVKNPVSSGHDCVENFLATLPSAPRTFELALSSELTLSVRVDAVRSRLSSTQFAAPPRPMW